MGASSVSRAWVSPHSSRVVTRCACRGAATWGRGAVEDDALLESTVPHLGSFAAEHLSPAYPQRAPWGTAERLRAWQAEALDRYFSLAGPDGIGSGPRDFLAAATPGAGK